MIELLFVCIVFVTYIFICIYDSFLIYYHIGLIVETISLNWNWYNSIGAIESTRGRCVLHKIGLIVETRSFNFDQSFIIRASVRSKTKNKGWKVGSACL